MALRPHKQSLQHCQQDKACAPCCQCCKKCNQQNQIRIKSLKDMIQKLKKDNTLQQKTNIILKRKYQQLNQIHSKCDNIDFIKDQLRQQLSKTLFVQKDTQIIILKSQVQQLKQQLNQIQQQNQQILKQNKQFKQIKDKLQQQLLFVTNNWQKFQKQSNQLKKINSKLNQEIKIIKSKEEYIQKVIRQKDQNISKLSKILSQTESYYNRQKSKVEELKINKIKNERVLKNKQQMLDALTQASDTQLKSLSALQNRNGKLNQMVNILQGQMYKHRIHQQVLVQKLYNTQDLAWDKTIKLDMIKNDIRNLKLAL